MEVRVSDTFLQVYFDGELKCEREWQPECGTWHLSYICIAGEDERNSAPTSLDGHTLRVYASDPWYTAAKAVVSNINHTQSSSTAAPARTMATGYELDRTTIAPSSCYPNPNPNRMTGLPSHHRRVYDACQAAITAITMQ